jgi:hypothetical protein
MNQTERPPSTRNSFDLANFRLPADSGNATTCSNFAPESSLVLPGDGIGPEIVGATLDMLREADRIFGLGLTFETAAIGFDSLRTAGTPSRIVVWVRPRDDLSTKGRRRAVGVAREASLWTSSGPPLLELPFRSGSVRRHLVPFHPTRRRPVRPRGPRLTCISAVKSVPHENVMSREEIIDRDDECYGHRRRRGFCISARAHDTQLGP